MMQVDDNTVHIIDHVVTRDAFVYVASEADQKCIVDIFAAKPVEIKNDVEHVHGAGSTTTGGFGVESLTSSALLLAAPGRPLVVSLVTPKPVADVARENRKRSVILHALYTVTCHREQELCQCQGERKFNPPKNI